MRTCIIDCCGITAQTEKYGYCPKHYARFRRHGDPMAGRSFVYQPKAKHCEHPGCDKEIQAKGLCVAHYTRLLRHGTSDGGRTAQGLPLDWLFSQVNAETDQCIKWPFAVCGKGYGIVSYKGRQVVASRLLCSIVYGEPEPKNLDCAHSCGKGHEGCVNPRHLRWATRSENHADKIAHGTTARGDQSPIRKICSDDALRIRELEGKESAKAIALRYGLSVAMIYKIWRRTAWAYV